MRWKMLAVVALPALSLLAACAEDGAAPAATPAATPAAAAPGPAGTRFDGRYSGESVLTVSRRNTCGAMTGQRTLTVSNGQGSFVVDRNAGQVATGPVQADGTVSLVAPQVRNLTVTGKIEGNRFTGTMRAPDCERSLNLVKR